MEEGNFEIHFSSIGNRVALVKVTHSNYLEKTVKIPNVKKDWRLVYQLCQLNRFCSNVMAQSLQCIITGGFLMVIFNRLVYNHLRDKCVNKIKTKIGFTCLYLIFIIIHYMQCGWDKDYYAWTIVFVGLFNSSNRQDQWSGSAPCRSLRGNILTCLPSTWTLPPDVSFHFGYVEVASHLLRDWELLLASSVGFTLSKWLKNLIRKTRSLVRLQNCNFKRLLILNSLDWTLCCGS